jgi:hypothetical protein
VVNDTKVRRALEGEPVGKLTTDEAMVMVDWFSNNCPPPKGFAVVINMETGTFDLLQEVEQESVQ